MNDPRAVAISNSRPHQITNLERVFVWSGGAIFVASLAFCAWWYLDVLGRPAAPRSWSAAAYDAALFAIFAAHHSVFARDGVKARLARVIPARLVRTVFVWIASVLLIGICVLWRPVGPDLYHAGGWRAWAHAAVQLAGIALVASAVRVIDPLELAGIRQPAGGGTLQIRGPYRWVRHPVYLGWMLAVFGAAHMTAARLAFAVTSSLYLVIAVPWEERSLERAFPHEYRAYRKLVRWRVVPYVY
jgi:protein-S-isoprenylcysteine O-methyltransferase Ste14